MGLSSWTPPSSHTVTTNTQQASNDRGTNYPWPMLYWSPQGKMSILGRRDLIFKQWLLLLLLLLFHSHANASTSNHVNPLYTIRAKSLYDAGFQAGTLASSQIQTWFQGEEMTKLKHFVATDGNEAFHNLQRDNALEFPELVQEMKGIADGAQVPLDWIWMVNLLPELESLWSSSSFLRGDNDHCTDIFSVEHTLHGHNEDWSDELKPLWYFVKYIPTTGAANFSACAGVVYPGTVVGFAPTWSRSIYSTMNSLYPKVTRTDGGLACSFVQRRAICESTSVEQVLERLDTGHWAASASINLMDLSPTASFPGRRRTMANVEAYLDDFSTFHVATNYSHMNMFQHLQVGITADRGDPSTRHRQKRIWEQQAPASVKDVVEILGDTQDDQYPIYRASTLFTLVLHNHELQVWINSNPKETESVYVWNLATFFDEEDNISEDTVNPLLS